uniref:MULE transposase domain-containing protein n=1 Tax=Panagrolaimus superbus TaxID=310955 RepID=A0A914YXL6_9BILA
MVEMLSVMKSYEGVMVLYYDPTYNIGDYYVSCLTWYHPFFNKYEIIAMHVHTTRHGELHKDFIEAVGRKFGLSSLTRIFLIITDMEFNFKNLWANLRHLYCSLHLNRNLKKKLAELLLDEYALCDLNVTFIELKTVQTYAEFDKKLKKEVEEHVAIFATDPEIIEVFMKYCTKKQI